MRRVREVTGAFDRGVARRGCEMPGRGEERVHDPIGCLHDRAGRIDGATCDAPGRSGHPLGRDLGPREPPVVPVIVLVRGDAIVR